MKKIKIAAIILATVLIASFIFPVNAASADLSKEKSAALFAERGGAPFVIFPQSGASKLTSAGIPASWEKTDGYTYKATVVKGKKLQFQIYAWSKDADTKINIITFSPFYSPDFGNVDNKYVKTSANSLNVKKGTKSSITVTIQFPTVLKNGIYKSIFSFRSGNVLRQIRVELTVVNDTAKDMVRLASGNKTDWVIIEKNNPSASEVFAVQEFKSIFKKITGADIKSVKESAGTNKKEIVIGDGSRTKAAGLSQKITPLGDDGFVIRIAQNKIVLAGSSVRGTLYSVYSFFEDYAGCKWLDSKTSVLPKSPNLTVPAVSRNVKPALSYREPFFMDAFRWEFAARNKSNGNMCQLEEKHGGKIAYAGPFFAHTFSLLVNPDEYPNNSEYFGGGQLCLTNPDVLKIVTEKVLLWLGENPTAKIVSVTQNDSNSYCRYDNCEKIADEEGTQSGVLLRFVNKVAKEVAKKHPDVLVDTFAYQYTAAPPLKVKPEKNVVIRLCSISCCFAHPFENDFCPNSSFSKNERFMEQLTQWSKIAPNLSVWDYSVSFSNYLLPYPGIYVYQTNIKTMLKNNVNGIMNEGSYNVEHGNFAELKAFVLAKLMWDADYNVDLAVNEFTTGYYGRASDYIRMYVDFVETYLSDLEHFGINVKPAKDLYGTAKFLKTGREYFDRAEKLVQKSSDDLTHVKTSEMSFSYVELIFKQESNKAAKLAKVDKWLNEAKSLGLTGLREYTTSDIMNDKEYLISLVEQLNG